MLEAAYAGLVNPSSNGILKSIVVIDGPVAGAWKRTLSKRGVLFSAEPFERFGSVGMDAIQAEAQRYAARLGSSLTAG